jgi:hypothetical protein
MFAVSPDALGCTSMTDDAEALFYDNPRTLDGRQLRFLTANQLFVMDDAVYVEIVYIENGRTASQSLRIPLSP